MPIKKFLASIAFSGMTFFGGINVVHAEKKMPSDEINKIVMHLEKNRLDKEDDLELRAKGIYFFKRDLKAILTQFEKQNNMDLSRYKKIRIKEIGRCRKDFLLLFDDENQYYFVDHDGFIDPKRAKTTDELPPEILFEQTDGTTTKIDLKKGTFIIEWHQNGKKMSSPVLNYLPQSKSMRPPVLSENVKEKTHN